MAYVRLEQTNCYNTFGIVRFLGSRILVDVNWRRTQFASYQNYALAVVELYTAFGLAICLDVRSSTGSGQEYLALVAPVFYCTASHIDGVCVVAATTSKMSLPALSFTVPNKQTQALSDEYARLWISVSSRNIGLYCEQSNKQGAKSP